MLKGTGKMKLKRGGDKSTLCSLAFHKKKVHHKNHIQCGLLFFITCVEESEASGLSTTAEAEPKGPRRALQIQTC